jgi:hypothetical protein
MPARDKSLSQQHFHRSRHSWCGHPYAGGEILHGGASMFDQIAQHQELAPAYLTFLGGGSLNRTDNHLESL